jgi:hypothetical protein
MDLLKRVDSFYVVFAVAEWQCAGVWCDTQQMERSVTLVGITKLQVGPKVMIVRINQKRISSTRIIWTYFCAEFVLKVLNKATLYVTRK